MLPIPNLYRVASIVSYTQNNNHPRRAGCTCSTEISLFSRINYHNSNSGLLIDRTRHKIKRAQRLLSICIESGITYSISIKPSHANLFLSFCWLLAISLRFWKSRGNEEYHRWCQPTIPNAPFPKLRLNQHLIAEPLRARYWRINGVYFGGPGVVCAAE